MSLSSLPESFESADGVESSASDSTLLGITDLPQKKPFLERPAVPVSGESRYLTQLWVSGNHDPWEEFFPLGEYQLDAYPPMITSLETDEETGIPCHEIKDKIKAALKLLTFYEKDILVQFWSPQVVGKYRVLTTVDQPFGLGEVTPRFISYRKFSECNPFLVDKDHEEEDRGPPARVYRRGLPEWTQDRMFYMLDDGPLNTIAVEHDLFGYLALPVFDSTTRLCVGVLELLMASTPSSYAYEVQQIHTAFKKMNLTTPQTFVHPTSNVPSDQKQNRMDKLHSILKAVCEEHVCYIAQTWVVSPLTSYVPNKNILQIQKSCSSFNAKCIGKVCMSTSGLPFYVQDADMWPFREACREQHLEKTRSIVGRALVTHGSCFCPDVSELSEEEYPLVYDARKSCLKGCFTIFVRSLEGDEYVLEFFQSWESIDHRFMLELVDFLKHDILVDSGFELGDVSSIEEVEPSKGYKNLSLDIEPRIIPTSSTAEANTLLQTSSSDSEPIVANVAESTVVPSRSPTEANTLLEKGSSESEPIVANVNKSAVVPSRYPIECAHGNETLTEAGDIKTLLKQGKKHKRDSLTLEAVQQKFGVPIGKAAESLGVGRSTLKRFCRDHNIPDWPRHKKNDEQLPSFDIVHGSPKTNVVNVMDMNMLTVKASFKEHMIRFPFPFSSGLLELENEVALRIKLEGDTKILLKYRDEDGDWILIACDADLHSVIGFLGSNTTLKLSVELADNQSVNLCNIILG